MNGPNKMLIWEWLVLSGSLPPCTKKDIKFVRFKRENKSSIIMRVLHLGWSTLLLKLELNGVQCVYRYPKQTEKGIDWGYKYPHSNRIGTWDTPASCSRYRSLSSFFCFNLFPPWSSSALSGTRFRDDIYNTIHEDALYESGLIKSAALYL